MTSKLTVQQSTLSELGQNSAHINNINKDIETGLDFILSNLEEPLFPRKISTYKTRCGQFSVSSKQEIINAFRESNYVDCRINAFLPFTNYKEVQICPPNLLFIDLDLPINKSQDFKSNKKTLNLTLDKTLRNINEKLNGFPSVLFSGNGYHIILPVQCPRVLENIKEFEQFDKPSEQFLRFVKYHLSNNKADKQHNPSFKSCLLRIPGSINSKNNKQVTIVQKWNGFRPLVTKDLLLEFRRYLIQKKIDEYNYRQKILNSRNEIIRISIIINHYYYEWIEVRYFKMHLKIVEK